MVTYVSLSFIRLYHCSISSLRAILFLTEPCECVCDHNPVVVATSETVSSESTICETADRHIQRNIFGKSSVSELFG